ncbi:COG4315 family predicted lipoprotein [Prescottella agglutinans]|uniref:COG4315 family predicted lipoprotein n=1 Tax=Prescottella agglutinans TaxID=1644129 RepID=UPI003D96F045
MRRILAFPLTVLAAGAVVVGCSDNDDSGPAQSPTPMPSTVPAAGPVLSTAQTGIGEVVVDVDGMTVYAYDRDQPGTNASACDSTCLQMWPPVTSDSTRPEVNGVAGTIGTIPGPLGGHQVTVNGMPLYLFAGDARPGSVAGQGMDNLWWALNPAGEKITNAPGG